MIIRNTIGDTIRAYRTFRKLTQEQLSELSGVCRTSLGAIERGIQAPRFDTLLALADALDVTLSQLVAEFDESGHFIIGRSTKGMRKELLGEDKPKQKRGRRKKADRVGTSEQVLYGIIAYGDNIIYGIDVPQDQQDYVSQVFYNLQKQGYSGDEAINRFEEIWPKIKEIYGLK